MSLLAKMSWLEQKLFLREPLTALFALALPLVVLFVMGGVFGNESTPEVYRGVGAMNYYVPAYLALVTASVGLISLPTHLASNRERGVLKRYRASGIPAWVIVGAQVLVMLVIAAVSAVVLVAAAWSSVPALVAADRSGAATRLRQTADPGTLLAQSDPDAAGRPRPRAPGRGIPAA